MLIASSSSFFSIDLQSPPLSLRSSANRLYVYKWNHLNEKIWRKWVLYLVLKDELTLLQIRLFVYFDNILLNPALWFRGCMNTSIWTWCNHVTCDTKSKAAFLQNETGNLPSPHNTTRLKISLQSMYDDLFLFSSLSFFHSLIFRQIYTAKRLFWYYQNQQVVPMLHTIFQNIIT